MKKALLILSVLISPLFGTDVTDDTSLEAAIISANAGSTSIINFSNDITGYTQIFRPLNSAGDFTGANQTFTIDGQSNTLSPTGNFRGFSSVCTSKGEATKRGRRTAMIYKNPDVDLRARSKKLFEIGLIVALTLVIAAFKFFPEVRGPQSIQVIDADQPILVLPPPTDQPDRIPPPARPPVIIVAPPDEVLSDITIDTDLVPDSDVPPPLPVIGDEDRWFEIVEEPPVPIDGYAALRAAVKYPEMAKRIGIEGTVVVLAYVEKDGTVSRTEVLKGIGFGCDEAAVKAVEKTKFVPGLQRDKPVRVKISVPLRFRLRN